MAKDNSKNKRYTKEEYFYLSRNKLTLNNFICIILLYK